MQILKETCAEIARNGFKKIMLLNGHGGNGTLLNHFVNSTLQEKNDYAVVFRDAYELGFRELAKRINEGSADPCLNDDDKAIILDFVNNGKIFCAHGCIEETSLVMAIAPELVDLSRANVDNGRSNGKTAGYREWGLSGATRFWYIEHPDHYSAEQAELSNERIGRALLNLYVERQVGAVRFLKQDNSLLEWNSDWYAKWVE